MGETVGFPPSDLTGTRTDSTPNATTQADDHNAFMARLNQLVAELVAHEDNDTTAHAMIPAAEKNQALGVAALDEEGLVSEWCLPPKFSGIESVFTEYAMLNQQYCTIGDLAYRMDELVVYILTGALPGTLSYWKPITGNGLHTFIDESGGSYTFALPDASKTVRMTSGSASTVTVPTNASVAFRIGQRLRLWQYGAGQVTLTGGGSVTINSRGGALKLNGIYSQAELTKVATDTWVAHGDLVT